MQASATQDKKHLQELLIALHIAYTQRQAFTPQGRVKRFLNRVMDKKGRLFYQTKE